MRHHGTWSGRGRRCAFIHRNDWQCEQPCHGDADYCWQHDPEMAEHRKRTPLWSSMKQKALMQIDSLAEHSCADTGLWAECVLFSEDPPE